MSVTNSYTASGSVVLVSLLCSTGLAAPFGRQIDNQLYGDSLLPGLHGGGTGSALSLLRDANQTQVNPDAACQCEPGMLTVAVLAAMATLVCVLAAGLLSRYRQRRSGVAAGRGGPAFCKPLSFAVPAGNDRMHSFPNAARLEQPGFLARRREQSSDGEHRLREFVFDFAHDLRTPLSGLEGYLETLAANGVLPADQQRQYIDSAQKQAARLRLLIDQMLEVSRLNAPELRLKPERFSLAELIQDTVLEFRRDALGKEINLSIEVGETAAFTTADIGLIQRVLENLLNNAIRCSKPGGEVTVAVEQREDALRVSVADDGPGIAEEHLPRIFERFYSRPNDDGAQSGSGGLGLAIARKALEMHGSAITVCSEVGAGTRFEFELRLDKEAG